MSARIGSLFSGVGGLDMAVEAFFGGETVWHCEFDPEPSKVLAAHWPEVPNLGDVTKVPWWLISAIDILCLGFPCQDLSLAGRRAGMRPGTRSGLWSDAVEAIRVLRPKVIIIENVRGLLSGCAESDSDVGPCPGCVAEGSGVPHAPRLRALGRVLGDLDALGFDAEWHGLLASDVGAPHGRFRVFVLAYARGEARQFWTGFRQGGIGWGRSDHALGPVGDAVDRPLLRTPVADELGGGPLHPDVAKERGQTLRLSGQVLALTGHLLPTPSASNPNDGEDVDGWLARRERVKETAANGNGMGMPLGIAVRMLPTPRASCGAASTETMYALGAERDDTNDRQGNVVGAVAWGEYEPAIRLWESLTRPAPAPTLPDGKNGNHRLAAVFPEWMMGYPAGHVTDIIGRNPAIKACGNGVVPQQAYAALDILWSRVLEVLAVAA